MWINNDKIIEIYENLGNDNKKFPCECTNCYHKSAHIYMHDHGDKHCGVWVWCSQCGAYSHVSSITPAWWQNPSFIEANELNSVPENLEKQSVEIDNWVNGLLACNKIDESQSFVVVDQFKVRLKTNIAGLRSGTEGILVVKNDLKTTTIQFLRNNGEVVELSVSPELLLKAVETL